MNTKEQSCIIQRERVYLGNLLGSGLHELEPVGGRITGRRYGQVRAVPYIYKGFEAALSRLAPSGIYNAVSWKHVQPDLAHHDLSVGSSLIRRVDSSGN